MWKHLFCLSALALALQAASAPPQTPQVGVVRGQDGTLRPLWGLSANLINGAPLLPQKVMAASFSNEFGLVLVPGKLELVNVKGQLLGTYSTAESKPVMSVAKAAVTAIAWLPSEQRFLRWAGKEFAPVPVDATRLPGPVVDAQLGDASMLDLLVQDSSGGLQKLRVSIDTGDVLSSENYSDVRKPALVIGSALVSATPSGIQTEIRGIKNDLPLANPSAITMERAGSRSVHVSSPVTHQDWILHLDQGQPTLSEIPAFEMAKPAEVSQ
jgi:hypothetical protein